MDLKTTALPVSIALVGALLGFFLAATNECAHATGTGAGPALSPGSEGLDLTPLIVEIRALGDRLVDLGRTPTTRSNAATGSDRISVPGTTDLENREHAADLIQVLDRCTALLERLERRSTSSSWRQLNTPPTTASREPLAHYDEEKGVTIEVFTKDHLMWSYQQVLDRYGKPDYVYPKDNGGTAWMYQDETGDRWRFTFMDGLVMNCGM